MQASSRKRTQTAISGPVMHGTLHLQPCHERPAMRWFWGLGPGQQLYRTYRTSMQEVHALNSSHLLKHASVQGSCVMIGHSRQQMGSWPTLQRCPSCRGGLCSAAGLR